MLNQVRSIGRLWDLFEQRYPAGSAAETALGAEVGTATRPTFERDGLDGRAEVLAGPVSETAARGRAVRVWGPRAVSASPTRALFAPALFLIPRYPFARR